MTSILRVLLLLTVLLAACSAQEATEAPAPEAGSAATVQVSDGTTSATFTQADLEALPQAEASFQGVSYVGVPLGSLLEAAGFPPGEVQEVKATATDGFSSTYDAAIVQRPDVIVAYAQIDGPLASDDGDFRMVVPDAGGSMNVRYLRSLQVTQ